ncbi:RT0821/Lpp0805 family surface protein [Syntrophotalea acetylenica]|uniref:RT0821/Lpp0805 family surface protein n=1 Tax=Syntrophotalea TaxID=2812025 RepID=UPI002A35A2D8|nr:RT0821/Lpp0805 family surface protein [Syntrophotalea acetylenica]MDY0260994.1 RT0821/Lpp0805 family surface protein [Syntrophotalea acetylenica]
MKKTVSACCAFLLLLSGCYGTMGSKETGGTLIGAGTGALIGSQIGGGRGTLVAVAVGTLAGALLGQEVGKSLDRADQLAMQQNAQYALEYTPTRQSTSWRNPDSGNYGSITPIETYQTPGGQYCREYLQNVIIGGQQQQAYGTACRQPDGTWKIIR